MSNSDRQRAFVETLQNQGQLDRVEEFVHSDAVDHTARHRLTRGGPSTP